LELQGNQNALFIQAEQTILEGRPQPIIQKS